MGGGRWSDGDKGKETKTHEGRRVTCRRVRGVVTRLTGSALPAAEGGGKQSLYFIVRNRWQSLLGPKTPSTMAPMSSMRCLSLSSRAASVFFILVSVCVLSCPSMSSFFVMQSPYLLVRIEGMRKLEMRNPSFFFAHRRACHGHAGQL